MREEHVERVRWVVAEEAQDGSMLELRCGDGPDADRYIAGRYTGLDKSPVLIDEARRLHPQQHFQVGDAAATGFRDQSFDYVTFVGYLDHEARFDALNTLVVLHEACRLARRFVFVAWRVPSRIPSLPEFEPFLAPTTMVRRFDQFELWKIPGPEARGVGGGDDEEGD
jgi:ubiquinone/menaquinone biosynthesis C-methylase UbiE